MSSDFLLFGRGGEELRNLFLYDTLSVHDDDLIPPTP